MNIKFENVMLQTDGQHKGTIAFLDTGLGHTFPRSKEMKSLKEEFPAGYERAASFAQSKVHEQDEVTRSWSKS